MKQIDFKKEFTEELNKKDITPYIAFLRVIAGRKFDRVFINKQFKKFIPENDYSKSELKELVEWLVKFSSTKL